LPDDGGGGFIPEDDGDSGGGGGGFIRDENDGSAAGGGFIRDDDDDDVGPSNQPQPDSDFEGPSLSPNQQIPLSSIPTALQLLDLPPDDAQVLAVFRNAASGWDNPNDAEGGEGTVYDGLVSLDDWRAVCAVLLEGRTDVGDEGDGDEDVEMENADEYREEDGDEDEGNGDGDDDEYADEIPSRLRTRRVRKRKDSSSDGSGDSGSGDRSKGPRPPTARQKKVCLEAFALIFPEASAEDLPKRRIGIEDVQRVAKLIGERLKLEEVRNSSARFMTCSSVLTSWVRPLRCWKPFRRLRIRLWV
jgi:hypothetical protein